MVSAPKMTSLIYSPKHNEINRAYYMSFRIIGRKIQLHWKMEPKIFITSCIYGKNTDEEEDANVQKCPEVTRDRSHREDFFSKILYWLLCSALSCNTNDSQLPWFPVSTSWSQFGLYKSDISFLYPIRSLYVEGANRRYHFADGLHNIFQIFFSNEQQTICHLKKYVFEYQRVW